MNKTTTVAIDGSGGAGLARSSTKSSAKGEELPLKIEQHRIKLTSGDSSEVNLPPLPISTFDHHLTTSSNVFTTREEELQRLLASERQRSEQRRQNYATLKEEHLRLQSEYLDLQTEMKQIMEETLYFKEKKNEEIERLGDEIETKMKLIEKLETKLKETDPDAIRRKFSDELKEPLHRLQREKDRLEREKEAAGHEIKLLRQQIEHLEKEHLDSIERVRLSYDAEVNIIKREKEEIRIRLIEASQSPDVAKLIALSDENARLTKRLQTAQSSMETAQEQYRAIQKRVEDFVMEHDQNERRYRSEIEVLQDKIGMLKKEMQVMRSEAVAKKQEVDELLAEIGVLKRLRETMRVEAAAAGTRATEEQQEIRRNFEKKIQLILEGKTELLEEIKKIKLELEAKNELINNLEKLVATKTQELNQKTEAVRVEEMEKMAKLVQEKKLLEATLASFQSEKQIMQTDMDTLRHQMDTWSSERLTMEREIMLLKVKVETQTTTIEDLEKIRRQHAALHDETSRLRAEVYDLQAVNRELVRIGQNVREEVAKTKELAESERRQREELSLANEKLVSRMSRRFEDERSELKEKIIILEKENSKLRTGTGIGSRPDITGKVHSRIKARQYSLMADRLNLALDQLTAVGKSASPALKVNSTKAKTEPLIINTKESDKGAKIVPSSPPLVVENTMLTIPWEHGREHDTIRQELETIRQKQAELEAYLLLPNRQTRESKNINSKTMAVAKEALKKKS